MTIKKATLLTILTAIGIGLVSCAIKIKDYDFSKVTTPVMAESNEQENKIEKTRTHTRAVNNTITDLSNKTLTFNYNITTQNNYNWQINFSTTYGTSTNLAIGTNTDANGLYYFMDYIWGNDTYPKYFYQPSTNYTWWDYVQSMTITIQGGVDATNPTLISWLMANSNIGQIEQAPDVQDGNFVSLQQLMLKILTLPFTFITQAFNVTLWPNTPYAFNISNFILALLAISAILFIIKLFTSGFSIMGNYSNNYQNAKLTKAKIAETKSKTNLNNRTDPNRKIVKKE